MRTEEEKEKRERMGEKDREKLAIGG